MDKLSGLPMPDPDDFNYICGLSTILVATIQEVKDRVSQMEFIFCSRMFPDIQTKSKLLQSSLANATKAVEDEWKKKEANLLSQLQLHRRQKKNAEEQLLQVSMSLSETKQKLMRAEGMVAKHEVEKKQLLGQLEDQSRKEGTISRLERELAQKNAEAAREKELHQELTRLANAKKAAEDQWKNKETNLLSQLELQRDQRQRAEERCLQLAVSLCETQIKLKNAEHVAAKHELEKKQLMGKLEDQTREEETVGGLKRELEQKTFEVAKEKELHQQLHRQIESKDQDLLLEQNKRRSLIEDYTQLKANYKHLKSQYTFLIGKIDKTAESKIPAGTSDDETRSDSPPNKRRLRDVEEKNRESILVVSKPGELNKGPSSLVRLQPNQDASSVSSPFSALSSHSTLLPPKDPLVHAKPGTSPGPKQPRSHWRETRARQEPGGVDPHDDFLNTPIEAARKLNRGPQEEAQALPDPPPQDMDFHNSDDETQDINVVPVPRQQNKSPAEPSNKGFKYIEPVRKKAERQNLKGVECKQCKKFYDAVLPDGRANGDVTNPAGQRCEHHDGVSRHRYRYAPPMTPEGFWNIGFESEM